MVFGYFYTVRPVFQKERLSEEVAQLQIKRTRSKKELAAVREQITGMRARLARAKKENKTLQGHYDTLKIKQRKLLDSASVAEQKRKRAIKQLSIEQKRLGHIRALYTGAAYQIFEERLQMRISVPFLRFRRIFSKDFSKAKIIEKISAAVPNIRSLINSSLDDFKPTKRVRNKHPLWMSGTFQSIVSKFRSEFKERESSIRIVRVNAKLWGDAYVSQLAKARKLRYRCVDKYWKGLAKHEKWGAGNLADMRSSKEYGKRQGAIFKQDCRIMGEYKITRSFSDAWSKYYTEVMNRVTSIPEDITNNVEMRPFPKTLLRPPRFRGVWVPGAEDLKFKN
ncbi:MAG TPA: hypothetical protein VFA48_11370 [Gammaproteobacteria bacterium]|nr:hypothetical protein [Gammaproteobacteria bacterium]